MQRGTLRLNGSDHSRAGGQPAQRVAAGLKFETVGEAVAVGVWIVCVGAENEFGEVVESVLVGIGRLPIRTDGKRSPGLYAI